MVLCNLNTKKTFVYSFQLLSMAPLLQHVIPELSRFLPQLAEALGGEMQEAAPVTTGTDTPPWE